MAKSTTTSKTTKKPTTAAKAPAAKPAPVKAEPAKTTSKAPAAKPAKKTVTTDAIAARAYEIWVEQGQPEGRDAENWARAEQELSGK